MPLLSTFGAASGRGFGLFVKKPISYATWNPSDKSSSINLSNGNLTLSTSSTAASYVRANIGKSTGKYYFELSMTTVQSTNNPDIVVGVGSSSEPLTYPFPGSGSGVGFTNLINGQGQGRVYHNGGYVNASPYYLSGGLVGVAVDLNAGIVAYYVNNSLAYTSPSSTLTSGVTYYPMIGSQNNPQQVTANFGASAFSYTPPSGYQAGWY